VRPPPHGAATDPVTGRGFYTLNTLGGFVSLDMRAEAPEFRLLPATHGSGGAAIAARPTAGLLHSPHDAPREGDSRAPGDARRLGKLAMIDARADRVAPELPILADGPDCTRRLADTPQIGARTVDATLAGDVLFLPQRTLRAASTPSHAVAVVDVSTPSEPRQLPSIRASARHRHRGTQLSGDGRFLIVLSNVDNVVHVIDTDAHQVVQHVPVVAIPNRVAVFGAAFPSRPPAPMPVAH